MLDALKDDRIINKFGGRFKFTALVQHRIRELMAGQRPLVERNGRNDFEVAVQEIVENKISLELTLEDQGGDEAEA
jgi:DNA-directed RNA polymerase subunit omega